MSPSRPKSFVLAGHVPPLAQWRMARHAHQYNEMILVISGEIETRLDGRLLRGKPGDVLFYPSQRHHEEKATGRESLETIFLAWHESPGYPTRDWPTQNFDRDGRLAFVIRWMLDLGGPGRRVPADTADMLETLLSSVLFEYAHLPQADESGAVARAIRYMRLDLSRRISLDDLAAAAHMSKYHFARLFAQVTGLPPMTFLRTARVEAAKALLAGTNLPLKSIAPLTGFTDECHLSNVFKAITGQTPGELRAASVARLSGDGTA